MATDFNALASSPFNDLISTPSSGGQSLAQTIANAGSQEAENFGGTFASGKSFQQKYNELFYDVDLYLDNSGVLPNADNTKRYFINPSAVLNLNISDTVNDWVADGSISIMYLPEDAPNFEASKTGNPASTFTNAAKQNGAALKSYQFRGDGYDLLRVGLVPKTASTSGGQKSATEGQIHINGNNPNWYLSYLLSIYEVEDFTRRVPSIDGPLSTYMKCVKLYFRDVRYQILRTTNLEYSTALSKSAIVDQSLDNGYIDSQGTPRVITTGQALNEVFNKALADTTLQTGCAKFAVSSSPATWDNGGSKIFYTSPADWNANDDVQYIYSHHVSSTTIGQGINDLCLLHTNRALTPGDVEQICLTPLAQFFQKAGKDSSSPGPLQLEHFFTTSQTDEKPPAVNMLYKAPMSQDSGSGDASKIVDLKTAKYGQIISFSFVDMSADVNSTALITTPVYSVNIGSRTFNTQFSNNDVVTAKNTIATAYIDQLYKTGDSTELFLPTLHSTKKSLNIFPVFSLNGDSAITRQKNGILNLINTGVFQNACICFKTLGLSLRKSGTFIGIDKSGGSPNDDYNNKLYGQYFVVKVDHIFEAGAYVNQIYAIKLHRFAAPSVAFGSTL
jgi:hypothetical protein